MSPIYSSDKRYFRLVIVIFSMSSSPARFDKFISPPETGVVGQYLFDRRFVVVLDP